MFSSFLSSLTKLSKPWQLVDEHGNVVESEDDDVSSISSDWSFMQPDGEFHPRSRSESPHILIDTPNSSRRSLNRSPNSGRFRQQSLPNSMDSPIRPCTDTQAMATTNRPNGLSRSARAKGTVRSGSLACDSRTSPNPVQSRQAGTRWNGAAHASRRKGHRNTLNVDPQHAKCLRRGAQNSRSYQRKQVFLLTGGQLPQARRN
ncbi:hypothetical protein FGIG_07419 [Fasciola gigantica]|uniref:Uncharacterized protein n=1 Tax=Fasciola gigantica TaxID=46835 RepID=A0A504YRV6_FASGI|nr:hypothetical protein FGIG_07419 [Fasciola gigantica]